MKKLKVDGWQERLPASEWMPFLPLREVRYGERIT
jgi:hypothetical protein